MRATSLTSAKTSSRELRRQLIDTSHAMHKRGWVANHDGNVTTRIGKGRFLATPTATSKADVSEGNLIEVDASGKRVSGTARPFGELSLHLAIFQQRADVNAVVHAHPPHATALACSGSDVIERPFIAEAIVSIGEWIPTVPYALPGADAVDALAPYIEQVDAVLLANHGVLSWGADLEQAYLRLELVEHLARIATLAAPTGGTKALPDSTVQALLAKRAKSGLGHAADMALEHRSSQNKKRVIACAPAPHANVEVVLPPKSTPPSRAHITSLIREELIRALKS